MAQTTNHDRLFKEIFTVFFPEFLDLFAPEAAALLDPASLEFLDKELFTDVTQGERLEVDIAAKGRLRDGGACFLVHLETQAKRQANFAERMFLYGARLYEKHRLPVYPIAVLSYDAPRTSEPNEFKFVFGDWTPLRYVFRTVQLNRLYWRDFTKRANPVASALMAKMAIPPHERVAAKLACLKMLAALRLDPARVRLVSGFIDTYLRLTATEAQALKDQLTTLDPEPQEAVMQIITSWMEEGLQKGIEQGLQQGLQRGRQDGEATVVLRILERRFGAAVAPEAERIRALPTEALEALADALLDIGDVEELKRWLASRGF